MHKSTDRLLLQRDYETGHVHEVFLNDVEIGWNYTQHADNVLPNYHRFGVMQQILGPLGKRSCLTERIAPMHMARLKTDTLRARDVIFCALDTSRCAAIPLYSFLVKEKFWLHRKRNGWRRGIVASIDTRTIIV